MRLRGALGLIFFLALLSPVPGVGYAATTLDPAKRHDSEKKTSTKSSKPATKASKPDHKTTKVAATDRAQKKSNPSKKVAEKSERPDRAGRQDSAEHAAVQHEERHDHTTSASDRSAARLNAAERVQTASSAPPDRYVGHSPNIGMLRVIGQRQIGRAAWYGGRHLGRRTASGDVLDSDRPTAAHRSLPLNSYARVTNLNNGRSVVVVVTDRGPSGGGGRLIDVSPRAADELDMKHDGVVPVAVEPVVITHRAAAE
jgi:rare lipoprotein A